MVIRCCAVCERCRLFLGVKYPVIALTAYAAEVDQQQALAAGFQLHLAKPIEPAALVTAIANLTGRSQ